MKRSIYLELVFGMTIIILLTIFIPFFALQSNINRIVDSYLKDEIISHAQISLEILENYDLPLEQMIELIDFSFTSTEVQETITSLNLTKENWKELKEQHITMLDGQRLMNAVTIIAYQNKYLILRWDISMLTNRLKRLGYLSAVSSLLAGFTVILIIGRRSTKVYRDLNLAAQKVAAGDFTQTLPPRKHPAELASTIDSFNKMIHQLQSIEMLRDGFISDVSHQFKTPLTAIEGFAQLLEHTESPEVHKECIDVITSESRRLSQLTDNILTLNRLNYGTFSLPMAPVCIDEQIRQALALNEKKWSVKNCAMVINLDHFSCEANDALLSQVWINLIDNAFKFSPANAPISITLKKIDAQHCVFTVHNAGIPIPKEAQSHIFEKFYRTDKSGATEGSGLGLSIVQRIIQLHNGLVHCTSDCETGTIFTVIL